MLEMRSIKFFNKKIVMRPQNKGVGVTEIWMPSVATITVFPIQFIIHDGVRYFLQQRTEKTQ
jgi:hypothetical protein